MPGRSLPIFQRLYIDGYDVSGYTSDSGEQGVTHPEFPSTTFTDAVTGYLVACPDVSFGPINGVFDNTALIGLHAIMSAGSGSSHNVMLARGVLAPPVLGDDVFAAPLNLLSYKASGSGMVTAKMTWSGVDANAKMLYPQYWGKLLHAFGSETGANSSNANSDNGAATTAGGWLMYHIYSITGTGTVTVSIDDSGNGTSWAALAGATSGAIATATAPCSGIIQLGIGATVRQYLRWQFSKSGSASAAVFTLGFMRGH